jgi:hypothetical protein
VKQNLNRRLRLNNPATNRRVPVLIENPEVRLPNRRKLLMLCLGVFFEGRITLIVFFVTNKEKKRDVRKEMFAKSMKRFN